MMAGGEIFVPKIPSMKVVDLARILGILGTKIYPPRRMIVFSRDEFKQFEMQRQLSGPHLESLRFFIGDVRDRDRLELAMREVDYVIHAAALKHVPAAEYNPMEYIHTNVYGAENVVFAALRAGVKRLVALSTDKRTEVCYGSSDWGSDTV